MTDSFEDRVKSAIDNNKIMIYMKGTPEAPQCGFSAAVIQIFNQLGKPYDTADILSDPEIRRRLPEFSNWPTFPQVFVGGQFVGGCDIVSEMNEKGELSSLLEKTFSN